MIVTPDVFFENSRIHLGVECIRTELASTSITHQPAMSLSTTLQNKEEPQDYGHSESSSPLNMSNQPAPASSSTGDDLESSSSEGDLRGSHMQPGPPSRSRITLKCLVCKFTCSERPQFNEHLRLHKFRCSECADNAESATDLKEHLKIVHGVDNNENSIEKDPNKPNKNALEEMKTFTCKVCQEKFSIKENYWNHKRVHIKPERIFLCPCCEFVTEYKHHLDYHLRNHWKHKPYSCDKCPYRCINPAMLSSHMKSHSNVYQFRCINCNYATKYSHSLKKHLKKYDHEPSTILNPDGSPNPLPNIFVDGRRRRPKQKPNHEQKPKQENEPVQEQQPQIEFSTPHQVPGIFHPYPTLMQTMMIYYNNLSGFGGFSFSQGAHVVETNNNVGKIPLDLSRSEPMKEDSNEEPPAKNRKKGKAFKLNRIVLRLKQQVEKEEYRPEQQQEVDRDLSRFGDFLSHKEQQQKLPMDRLVKENQIKKDSTEEPAVKRRRKSIPSKRLRQEAEICDIEYEPEQHNKEEDNIHHKEQQQEVETEEYRLEEQKQMKEDSNEEPPFKRRRKTKPFKFNSNAQLVAKEEHQQKQFDKQQFRTQQQQIKKQQNLPEILQQAQTTLAVETPQSPEIKPCEADNVIKTEKTDVKFNYTCVDCGLRFSSYDFYTVHMGYHGYDDPFKCNMCGKQTEDALALYLHIAKNEHP